MTEAGPQPEPRYACRIEGCVDLTRLVLEACMKDLVMGVRPASKGQRNAIVKCPKGHANKFPCPCG